MSNREFLAEQQQETRLIIEELLADGSDPEALYTIEHHLSSVEFNVLEKAAIESFKLGYDVTDAEELELEDGSRIFCCDVISKVSLQAELINRQVEQLVALAERCRVNYDSWGTYFESPDEAEDDEDQEERGPDNEDHHRRH